MARPGLIDGLGNRRSTVTYLVEDRTLILQSKVTYKWSMKGYSFKVSKYRDWIEIRPDGACICIVGIMISYDFDDMRYNNHLTRCTGPITESVFLREFNYAYRKLWNQKLIL